MRRLPAAALLALSTAASWQTAAAKSPRLILFSLGDDFGFNNVGYPHGPDLYANPEMRTPNLDRLAMGGVRLERHCEWEPSRALRAVHVFFLCRSLAALSVSH